MLVHSDPTRFDCLSGHYKTSQSSTIWLTLNISAGSGRVASYRYKLVSRRLHDSVIEASGQSEASKRNQQDRLGHSSARADSRLTAYSATQTDQWRRQTFFGQDIARAVMPCMRVGAIMVNTATAYQCNSHAAPSPSHPSSLHFIPIPPIPSPPIPSPLSSILFRLPPF
jgi:hypothetical protein